MAMILDLSDEEARALLNVLIDTIEADRYPRSPRIRLLREIIATCSNSRTGSADWALPSVTWWSDGPSPVSAAEPCGCRACHLCVSSLAGC